MPWMRRPSRRRPALLSKALRRWRYDHSQGLTSFWIGAAVVVAVGLVLGVLRLIS